MSFFSGLSDIKLLEAIQSGERDAFTELYSRYWKKLFTVAVNKTGQLEEAEEIVQDVFISLWKRRLSLEVTTSLQAYLAVSVKYRVIKLLASRHQHQKYCDYTARSSHQLTNITSELLAFDELKATLELLVADLPEKCRFIYRLSREEGLSHRQIALTCGIAEKTVEAHISKALKVLRTGLDQVLL